MVLLEVLEKCKSLQRFAQAHLVAQDCRHAILVHINQEGQASQLVFLHQCFNICRLTSELHERYGLGPGSRCRRKLSDIIAVGQQWKKQFLMLEKESIPLALCHGGNVVSDSIASGVARRLSRSLPGAHFEIGYESFRSSLCRARDGPLWSCRRFCRSILYATRSTR